MKVLGSIEDFLFFLGITLVFIIIAPIIVYGEDTIESGVLPNSAYHFPMLVGLAIGVSLYIVSILARCLFDCLEKRANIKAE